MERIALFSFPIERMYSLRRTVYERVRRYSGHLLPWMERLGIASSDWHMIRMDSESEPASNLQASGESPTHASEGIPAGQRRLQTVDSNLFIATLIPADCFWGSATRPPFLTS